MVRRASAFLSTAGAFALLLAAGAQTADARLSCGDTVKSDTKLTRDLVNCPNNGIVIGAANITLDLNGHTVAGDGELVESCPRNTPCDIGVVSDGHDGVTVTGGSVREFAVGVIVRKASDNRVLDISSSKNLFFGLLVVESDHSLIRDSSGSGNLAPDGDGLGLFGSDHIRVVDNVFRNNLLGIHIDGSTDNLFRGNVITGTPGPGMIVEADDNEIVGNRIARNAEGIILAGSANVIARNQFLKARGCGPDCGLAVSLEDGHDNLIARNIVRSPGKLGIRLVSFGKAQRIRDNTVRRNSIQTPAGPACSSPQAQVTRCSNATT